MASQTRRRPSIEKYWIDFYCEDHCTLCGNKGIIDTRGTKTPAGLYVGKLNWCICPNGQIMRIHFNVDPTEEQYKEA